MRMRINAIKLTAELMRQDLTQLKLEKSRSSSPARGGAGEVIHLP